MELDLALKLRLFPPNARIKGYVRLEDQAYRPVALVKGDADPGSGEDAVRIDHQIAIGRDDREDFRPDPLVERLFFADVDVPSPGVVEVEKGLEAASYFDDAFEVVIHVDVQLKRRRKAVKDRQRVQGALCLFAAFAPIFEEVGSPFDHHDGPGNEYGDQCPGVDRKAVVGLGSKRQAGSKREVVVARFPLDDGGNVVGAALDAAALFFVPAIPWFGLSVDELAVRGHVHAEEPFEREQRSSGSAERNGGGELRGEHDEKRRERLAGLLIRHLPDEQLRRNLGPQGVKVEFRMADEKVAGQSSGAALVFANLFVGDGAFEEECARDLQFQRNAAQRDVDVRRGVGLPTELEAVDRGVERKALDQGDAT